MSTRPGSWIPCRQEAKKGSRLTLVHICGKLLSAMDEPHQIERLSKSVVRIPMLAPTIPPATRINTFVITTERGYWIVDPGSPHPEELERLLTTVDQLPLGRGHFRAYVVTHHHRDHWGGLERLLALMPAPVVAKEPKRLGLTVELLGLQRLRRDLEGFLVELAPGHAADHIVVLTPERDLIAGDVVAGEGTVVIDPPDGHLGDYLSTLRSLLALEPRRVFPAHGHTVEDGAAKLQEYIDHRLEREAQVIHWLKALAPAMPADLVPHIYGDVPLFLHPLAARSVLAHLIKLEEEGRARNKDGTWSWSE